MHTASRVDAKADEQLAVVIGGRVAQAQRLGVAGLLASLGVLIDAPVRERVEPEHALCECRHQPPAEIPTPHVAHFVRERHPETRDTGEPDREQCDHE